MVDGNKDRIVVQGIFEGALQDGIFNWTTFNIGNVFTSWSSGAPLNVVLNYDERNIFGRPQLVGLTRDTSILRLEYTDGTAPVPEPSTMLLVGSGLIGLVGFRRKFKK